MITEDLTVENVKEMSDEEVTFWFGTIQQEEQSKKMRQAILDYLDVRDVNENPNTLKFNPGYKVVENKVIN